MPSPQAHRDVLVAGAEGPSPRSRLRQPRSKTPTNDAPAAVALSAEDRPSTSADIVCHNTALSLSSGPARARYNAGIAWIY